MKKISVKIQYFILLAAGLAGSVSVVLGVGFDPMGTLPPPIVTLIDKNLTNNELFYIGGTSAISRGNVVIYIQSSEGAVISQTVETDEKGNWFYSYPEFLNRGSYMVWTQLKKGDSLSPPSPQSDIEVIGAAVSFGKMRISYEFFYASLAILAGLMLAILLVFIFYHWRHHRVKEARLKREVFDIEQSVKREFALLKKDIEAELALVRSLKSDKNREEELRAREEKIIEDLAIVRRYIGKEIYDIEKLESLV